MIKKFINWIRSKNASRKLYKNIKSAEVVLGIKLYKWQVDYILGNINSLYSLSRGTGKTFAYDLRLLLNPEFCPKEPIYFNSSVLEDEIVSAPTRYRKEHWCELHRLYDKLSSARISVNHIVFKSTSRSYNGTWFV